MSILSIGKRGVTGKDTPNKASNSEGAIISEKGLVRKTASLREVEKDSRRRTERGVNNSRFVIRNRQGKGPGKAPPMGEEKNRGTRSYPDDLQKRKGL